MRPKIVLSFSGGMDSTTLLKLAEKEGEVAGLGLFLYGSKHNHYEDIAVTKITTALGYTHRLHSFDLSSAFQPFKSNLLKGQGEIPEGHYEDKSMQQTVVPGRNMIFISILAGLAQSIGAQEVWLGIHAGDHAIYPDCRPEFFFAMKEAVQHATDNKVTIAAPFLHMTKVDICRLGFQLKAPYRFTRTCYKNQAVACGKCGSCQERLAAFAENGGVDPLEYESREILPKGV